MKYEIRKLCDSEALRLACRTIVFNEKLLTTYETMRVDDGRRKSHTPNLKTVLPNNIAIFCDPNVALNNEYYCTPRVPLINPSTNAQKSDIYLVEGTLCRKKKGRRGESLT